MALLPGRLTPRLQEQVARLSSWMPFAHAVRELHAFTGVHVDPSTARRITERAGATLVTLQTQEATQALLTVPALADDPGPLVVSVDGAMVPLQHGVWSEVRTLAIGVPQQTTDAHGAVGVKTTQLSYFSRMTDSATFTELASGELVRRGVLGAAVVGGVVDGAEWCQTFLDRHVPAALRILDFPHAAGYVQTLGEAAGPAGRLLDRATVSQVLHDLKHQGAGAVLPQLRAAAAMAQDAEAVGKVLAYVEKRAAQMDYPQFQAAGMPIGSGMVESANKLEVEARLKGAGMHWAAAHVNPMLALRNALGNDRWVACWTELEAAQRAGQRARRAARVAPQPAVEPAARSARAAPPALPADIQARVQAELAQERRTHPWKRAWSVRQQSEEAATA